MIDTLFWFLTLTMTSTCCSGWTVLDETGRTIGTVAAHEDIPGNPCIVLRTERGEALIPLHEELVLEIDEENETLRMVIPEGLLDL